MRTSAVTLSRQLAPTMGPAHGGFEFFKGSFEGIKGYAAGRMTKSHRDKLYIDDAGWGPEAGSIEYGFWVPFGGIHVFIDKIGKSEPESNASTNIIKTAQRARPARNQPVEKCAFMGFIHGAEFEEGSVYGGETAIYSDVSRPQERLLHCISYKTAGLGDVPMAIVFRTPMSL